MDEGDPKAQPIPEPQVPTPHLKEVPWDVRWAVGNLLQATVSQKQLAPTTATSWESFQIPGLLPELMQHTSSPPKPGSIIISIILGTERILSYILLNLPNKAHQTVHQHLPEVPISSCSNQPWISLFYKSIHIIPTKDEIFFKKNKNEKTKKLLQKMGQLNKRITSFNPGEEEGLEIEMKVWLLVSPVLGHQ